MINLYHILYGNHKTGKLEFGSNEAKKKETIYVLHKLAAINQYGTTFITDFDWFLACRAIWQNCEPKVKTVSPMSPMEVTKYRIDESATLNL